MKNEDYTTEKVVFVLPSLEAGGAERILSFISQNLDQTKFNSKLLVAGFEYQTAFEINNIEVKYLNKKRILFAIPSFFIYFLKHKPKIVLSSMAHVNIVMALMSRFFFKTKFYILQG